MATQDLVKIALKSSHKMSLNERFQLLRQQNQMKRQNNSLVSNKLVQNNAKRHQLRQGSQKNRRLALQMANRPSVLAALRTNANQNNGINRSVKQRLGFKKLNNQLNNESNPLNVNRNQTKTRINRMNFNSNLNRNPNLNPNRNLNRNPNRNLNRNLNPNRKPNGRINSQNIGVIVGVRRKGFGLKRTPLRRTQAFRTSTNVTAFKPKRRVGPQNRGQNQAKSGQKKRFQLNRNFNARNNSGKQNIQKKRNFKPNREQLDNDLDQYMAKTKTHLDAELDAYMSQT